MAEEKTASTCSRRQALKLGLGIGGTAMLPLEVASAKRRRRDSDDDRDADGKPRTPFPVIPWSQPLTHPDCAQGRIPGSADALRPRPGNYPAPRFENPLDDGPEPAVPEHDYDRVAHGIAPEFDPSHPAHCPSWNRFDDPTPHHREYKLITEETLQQIIPGIDTPVFAYRDAFAKDPDKPATTPGPTFVSRLQAPAVVRNENHLTANRHLENELGVNTTHHDHETSIHLHGGHAPAHADGYPDFYVLAGEARDYFYPNIAPPRIGEGCASVDETWIPSTIWYHDHGMDVTGFNVSRGLAGFYLIFDDRELELILNKVLPSPGRAALECLGITDESVITPLLGEPGENDAGFDFGLALQDQHFNPDGSLYYDFLDHAGHLGDVFTVNGRAQPYFDVQRRKYRFRILNASNARHYQLRLSSGQDFVIFGADGYLFPVTGEVNNFELAPGQRHDVIIDFSEYPDQSELFLENILIQEDGRGGDDIDHDRPTPLLKFIIHGDEPIADDVSVTDGTVIRGFASEGGQWAPISADEVIERGIGSNRTPRQFEFDRGGGVWTINNRFFNPRRADAVPQLDTAERWIVENGGGGWWHPIHTHLEGFQIQSIDGKPPPFERSFNSDLVNLHGGEEAEFLIKFRSFTGPFVFHCHAIEHEDMRMMGTHDPRPAGEESPLDGETRIDPRVSGVVPDCIELEEEGYLYFDVAGDLDRLEDRGVGFPECEFDMDERGND